MSNLTPQQRFLRYVDTHLLGEPWPEQPQAIIAEYFDVPSGMCARCSQPVDAHCLCHNLETWQANSLTRCPDDRAGTPKCGPDQMTPLPVVLEPTLTLKLEAIHRHFYGEPGRPADEAAA